MNKETREQIALCKFKIISPVLAEPGRVQNEYFRGQAQKAHVFPHYGERKLAVSTFKLWLKRYRKNGFDGLKPIPRSDYGRPRRLSDKSLAAIEGKCKAYPHKTVRMLFEDLRENDLLGDPPICYNTLLRCIQKNKWLDKKRKDIRKRFETDETNDLWLCDFMHGPQVTIGRQTKKAILCAIIDDHSRMIVGYTFSAHETLSVLTLVLKEALLTFGCPKRLYVDNGPAFSADALVKSCALVGISLIHSKPYDAPSRGKIERFFHTVRERFLSCLRETRSLDELNETFALWLEHDYTHKIHSGIDQRPIDRYNASLSRVNIRRLSRQELDHIFLIRHERIVNNDSTISFKGRIYEVPAAYIRQCIDIRHPVDDITDLGLYDKDVLIGKLHLVDVKENSRTFRPAPASSRFSFAKEEVLP